MGVSFFFPTVHVKNLMCASKIVKMQPSNVKKQGNLQNTTFYFWQNATTYDILKMLKNL